MNRFSARNLLGIVILSFFVAACGFVSEVRISDTSSYITYDNQTACDAVATADQNTTTACGFTYNISYKAYYSVWPYELNNCKVERVRVQWRFPFTKISSTSTESGTDTHTVQIGTIEARQEVRGTDTVHFDNIHSYDLTSVDFDDTISIDFDILAVEEDTSAHRACGVITGQPDMPF